MMIGEIALNEGLDLSGWLQNEEVKKLQKAAGERILQFLFTSLPDSSEGSQFVAAIQALALVGCPLSKRAFLQKAILELHWKEDSEIIPCGLRKSLKRTSRKVSRFLAEHRAEILVGALLCATGIGIAAVTGYTCSAAVGGVVIAGAGSIFSKEESSKGYIPNAPPPSSKEEIALAGEPPFPSVPKLELPASANEFLVTAEGIWANGQFFSHETLKQPVPLADAWVNSTPLKQGADERLDFLSLQDSLPTQSADVSLPHERIPELLQNPSLRRSQAFTIEGKHQESCHICWINGINNTFEECEKSGTYLQNLAGGHAIAGIYNCTHGPLVDILEAAFLNYPGYSPNTAQLLQKEWRKFHEAMRDQPNARLLQICHSQGTIAVKNALTEAPSEIRDRVIVIAIAPAAVVCQHGFVLNLIITSVKRTLSISLNLLLPGPSPLSPSKR